MLLGEEREVAAVVCVRVRRGDPACRDQAFKHPGFAAQHGLSRLEGGQLVIDAEEFSVSTRAGSQIVRGVGDGVPSKATS